MAWYWLPLSSLYPVSAVTLTALKIHRETLKAEKSFKEGKNGSSFMRLLFPLRKSREVWENGEGVIVIET